MNPYVNLNRLEFFITAQCSSNCKHCIVKPKRFINRHIDKDLAVNLVHKLSANHQLDSVMTFGGEPLLYPEIVGAIHQAATNSGIPKRQVITNGCWSKDPVKVKQIAAELAVAGVNSVLISVDGFHQEFISSETVRKSALALLDSGIVDLKWNPCWVVSQNANNVDNEKTRSILEALGDLPVTVSGGNILSPEGAALENLADCLPDKRLLWNKGCSEISYASLLDSIKSICIEPDGHIPICKGFTLGNAVESDIINLLDTYDPYRTVEMKVILEGGMAGLIDYAKTKGVMAEPDGYYTQCDMCFDLRQKINAVEI